MDVEAIAGRYRREERLGIGGMAEVWSAWDLELNRRVAIKFLGQGAESERFRREARAVASLSHPNICQLYDYGEAGERPYMVLEYLPGGTLEDRLAGGEAMPDAQTAEIAREVAAGLAHAHEKELVHRDLKPANILFDSAGRAKIADFGIARAGDARTITEAGTLLGTVAYLSPEQASGETATPASDVYAFGVILYRMLSGRLPFESADALDLVRKHREEAPPPLPEIRPDVPPVLESLAMASLAKSPTDRPVDGGALLDEIGAEQETLLLARADGADGATQVLRIDTRRRGLVAGVLAVALLGAGIAAAVIVTGDGGSARAPQVPSRPGTTTRTTPTTEQVFTEPVSTQPETTVESTTVSTEPVATTQPETSPTEPVTAVPTDPAPVTVPPPVSTLTETTFTEPATTDVPTFTTEPTTTEPLPTTDPGTTVVTTTPGAP